MTVNLYTFVGMYSRLLDTAAHILAKGAEHAQAIGVSEADMLEWRLIDDMFPLRNQIQAVANFAGQWPARAAGVEMLPTLEGPQRVAELQAALAAAKAHLAGLRPEQFEGRDDVALTVDLGQMSPTFGAGQWLTGFSTTNFYFHLSIAYAILRSKGVQIGKRDLFAGGL